MLRCQYPSVCPSFSVMEVHWRIIANLRFKFRSKFTARCRRVEGSSQQPTSRAMLATTRPSCWNSFTVRLSSKYCNYWLLKISLHVKYVVKCVRIFWLTVPNGTVFAPPCTFCILAWLLKWPVVYTCVSIKILLTTSLLWVLNFNRKLVLVSF